MIKKRVQFDIEEEEEEIVEETKNPFNKKFKHTLDSDEEDDEVIDEKKYEFNSEDNLFKDEEEGNLHNEGEITITPFNCKDELKEGYFDKNGMYIFKKEKDEIKDVWLDNIDWVKIKQVDENYLTEKNKTESIKEEKFDSTECFKKILELMNPGETVQKSIQRLGKSNKNKLKNKNKQRMKNLDIEKNSKEVEEEKERKQKLDVILDLTNQLMNSGDINIYEKNYELIKRTVENNLKRKHDELDMFSND